MFKYLTNNNILMMQSPSAMAKKAVALLGSVAMLGAIDQTGGGRISTSILNADLDTSLGLIQRQAKDFFVKGSPKQKEFNQIILGVAVSGISIALVQRLVALIKEGANF